MASTRNRNTPGNYYLEQRDFRLAAAYDTYTHSAYGAPSQVAMPILGITPSRMARDTLSTNAVDIESQLRGINSTNLVTPAAVMPPQLKRVKEVAYFNTLPLQMPHPLVIEPQQRPSFGRA